MFSIFPLWSAFMESQSMENVGEKSKNMENKCASSQSMKNMSFTSLDPLNSSISHLSRLVYQGIDFGID
jgi:hypothetical protein